MLSLLLACAGGDTPPSPPGPSVQPEPAPQAEAPPPPHPEHPWPAQEDPRWPAGCLLENAEPHPTQPWLALACTNTDANSGALMIFDASLGALRSVLEFQDYVGWSDTGLMRWHPEGLRVTVNVGTNGIALVDGGALVGTAFPDQTRDHGVQHVWVGDRLLADTGAFFAVQPGDWRFEFDELDMPPLQALQWNASISAVVGRLGTDLMAWDPLAEKAVWSTSLDEHGPGNPTCGPEGQLCVRRQWGVHPAPDALLFVDGDTGAVKSRSNPASPRIWRTTWGPGGTLAVASYVHRVGGDRLERKVELFRDGASAWSHALGERRLEGSHDVAGCSELALSSQALALLLDGQEVRVLDAGDGAPRASFPAPAPPPPPGLPDWYDGSQPGDLVWASDRHLVRLAGHFVTAYTADGERVGQVSVPGP